MAGGVLVWKVEGGLPEERDDSFWGQVRGSGESTFSETLFGLMRAAKDRAHHRPGLDVRGADMDWAKLEELRGAVGGLPRAGQARGGLPRGGLHADYALATAADRIVLAPEANLMVLGLSAEMAFLKDTLAKLGMEADFVHVGAYKSAPERMTRSSASEANREMVESIVGDQFDALLDMLADGRGADRDEVEPLGRPGPVRRAGRRGGRPGRHAHVLRRHAGGRIPRRRRDVPGGLPAGIAAADARRPARWPWSSSPA